MNDRDNFFAITIDQILSSLKRLFQTFLFLSTFIYRLQNSMVDVERSSNRLSYISYWIHYPLSFSLWQTLEILLRKFHKEYDWILEIDEYSNFVVKYDASKYQILLFFLIYFQVSSCSKIVRAWNVVACLTFK